MTASDPAFTCPEYAATTTSATAAATAAAADYALPKTDPVSRILSSASSTSSASSALTLKAESVVSSTSTAVGSVLDLPPDKKKSQLGSSSVAAMSVSGPDALLDASGVPIDASRSRRLKNSIKKTVSAMGSPPTTEYDVEHGRASKRLGVSPMGCGIHSHV